MGGRPEYTEEAKPAPSILRVYRVQGRSAVAGQKSDQALQIDFCPPHLVGADSRELDLGRQTCTWPARRGN